MLRVMLADSNPIRLAQLQTIISWAAFGCEPVGYAADSQQYRNMIDSLCPDVIIAEITLVLEMTMSVFCNRQHTYQAPHIILFGQDATFGSARLALQVGADDYLLTPIDPDKLCEILQQIQLSSLKEHELKRMQKAGIASAVAYRLSERNTEPEGMPALSSLLSRYFGFKEDPSHLYYLSLITLDEYRYIIQNQDILDFTVQSVAEQIMKINEYIDCLLTDVKANRYAMLTTNDPETALRAWRRQQEETQEFITVVYSDNPVTDTMLQPLFQQLNEHRNDFVLGKGSGFVLPMRDTVRQEGQLPRMDMPDDILDEPIEALIAGDIASAQAWLKNFFDHNDCMNIHLLTVELVDRLDRELQKRKPSVGFSSQRKMLLIKRLLDVESTAMLYQMMQTHLQELMGLIEPKKYNYRERIVRETLQYIETHYQQPFTTDQLAAALHYSPNHLRYIFKQVKGHTLTSEITTLRLEQACAMLSQTSCKVHEIAQQVGYANPSYFISQFLKRYGMTPMEYRNSKG